MAKSQADLISTEQRDSTFLPLNGWNNPFFVKRMESENCN